MHCTLNPNSGFKPFHLDPTQQQRDFHALHNLPMPLYNSAAIHDYWNNHSAVMRPDYANANNIAAVQVLPGQDSPPTSEHNNHGYQNHRDNHSAEKELTMNMNSATDPFYPHNNESSGSGSGSSPLPPADVNYYYMSPGGHNSNSNSSVDNRSSTGSSSNMELSSYHRQLYDHAKANPAMNSGNNSLDLLTKQVGQYEPVQIVPISALLDDDDFDFLLEPEFNATYRRGSTCSTNTASSLNFSRRSSSVDHFDSIRQRTSPPSPSVSPPALLIDATNYSTHSSTNHVSRMQTPEFRHPEMDSSAEFGKIRSSEQESRRHSFGATSAIAELARLKIRSAKPVQESIGENVDQVGNLQALSSSFDNRVYSNAGFFDSGVGNTAASGHFAQKRHSIPELSFLPSISTLIQASNIVEKNYQHQQAQFTRRRESVSSLSDENHHSHDELGADVSSPESADVNRERRDSDVSVKIIDNDPQFLFLGPCGKKRRIIRERKLSEPSEDHDHDHDASSSEARRSSLGDTRSHLPLRIIKQEPQEYSDEASDSVRPLNLCIIEETRSALEKVCNLTLSSDSLIPPSHYFEERRKSTSSIESLPPLLPGGLRALSLSGQSGLEGPVIYRTDRRFSEPIVSSLHKPEKKKLKCPDCPKEFSQLRNFRYHRSKHEGTETFACTCPVCGKHFNDKGYLSSHLKIHRNAKEYHCEWCPKSFNQRVAYNMHIRIHTGLKPHQCELCPKSFSRKMLLRQHLRTHTGERPYQCDVCNKCFADRSNMLLHKRLHSGERPYKCQECSKTFSKNHHLKTHMNHHAGIKPYQCEKCKACFSQSSNMKTHFRKCTGVAAPGAPTTGSPTTTSPHANIPKASPGRPPKQSSPRGQKSPQQQQPGPMDHISVIAHTSAANEFLYESMNRRRSNPCLGQRNFFESHLQQQGVPQPEGPGQFRKHSSSFSGPSAAYGRHAQMYPMGQDPRFLTARNAIDLNSAIQFSLSRVESSPLARFNSGAHVRPGMLRTSPSRSPQRVSPPVASPYHHPPPPPSPTGDILRNSLLNKTPTQYQAGRGASPNRADQRHGSPSMNPATTSN